MPLIMTELDELLARIADPVRHGAPDTLNEDRRDAYRMLPMVAARLKELEAELAVAQFQIAAKDEV